LQQQEQQILVYHSVPAISIDADAAREIGQRYNVIVSSICSPGVGRTAESHDHPTNLGVSSENWPNTNANPTPSLATEADLLLRPAALANANQCARRSRE
jgi:hypothetical protein